MADIKQQIFQELAHLEDAAARLRGTAIHAGKQTDLEVAILTEQVRVLRDNIVIHQGEVGSLQRCKDAAKEVTTGYECGMSILKFNDIKEGDIFECFQMQEIKQ